MKKIKTLISIFLCLILLISLCACGGFKRLPSNEWSKTTVSGEIGAFSLLAPINGEQKLTMPEFSWQSASNASHYTVEICSSTEFAQSESVYIKKTGVTATSLLLTSALREKNTTYYWRVTAHNESNRLLCNGSYGDFYLAADVEEEIPFAIEYTDEWTVHPEGSYADIAVDKSDFFGNGKNSLTVSFVEEDTNQGLPDSDGWIVVTKSQEAELYGVDSFYFNFYYSGDDADVYLRVIDADNEYWNAQIKLANNTKQTIIIPFTEFTLRTKGGTTIANQVFDYNYIKGMEVVFEKSFGDGVMMLSDIKAVSFEKYSHLFIDQVDFSDFPQESLIKDNYDFVTQIADGGDTIDISYGGDIQGYGFVKLPINTFLASGDAISVKLKCSNTALSSEALIRLIEEDGDRWVYTHPYSALSSGEFVTVIIPYSAFTLSEYNGDGARQFYYLKQIQLGMQGAWQSGSITVSEFKVVRLDEVVPNLHQTTVTEDGVIDDFDDYDYTAQMYYTWQLSSTNKDEALNMNKQALFGGTENVACGEFTYKSDMGFANYGVRLTTESEFSALRLWAKDTSTSASGNAFDYLDSVCAKMLITIHLTSGETYQHEVAQLTPLWSQYTVPFDDFLLTGTYYGETAPITSQSIEGVQIGFQYYYYLSNGDASPQYVSNNTIYLDNIAFCQATETEVKALEKYYLPDDDNALMCTIDTFDQYADYNALEQIWHDGNVTDYSGLALQGTTDKQLAMSYKGNSTSVNYFIAPNFGQSVSAKGIRLTLTGDNKATVYINIYFTYAEAKHQYRYTLNNLSDIPTEYIIGFSNFTNIGGGSQPLSNKTIMSITKITFGIVNYTDNLPSTVYVDDIVFDGEITYDTLTTQSKGE